ncbi:MAG: hypothetical protein JRJ60_16530 [Deltaproteobacteria bacterium]|nr:hypothetical protein [Deltaproteobacteria bacterium]
MKKTPAEILEQKIEDFSSMLIQSGHKIQVMSESSGLNPKTQAQLSELAEACDEMKSELSSFQNTYSTKRKAGPLYGSRLC